MEGRGTDGAKAASLRLARFAAEGSEDDGAWERGAVEDGRMVSGRTLQDESRSFAGKALGEGGR